MAKQEVAGSGWKFPESYNKVMDYVDKTDPNLLYCVLVIPFVPFYWNLVSVRFPKYLSHSLSQFCVVLLFGCHLLNSQSSYFGISVEFQIYMMTEQALKSVIVCNATCEKHFCCEYLRTPLSLFFSISGLQVGV